MKILDVTLLSNLPPFAGIENQDLEDLLGLATSTRHEKGQHIFDQGDDANAFFLLLDGHVRVVKITPHGEQIIARYISSGELFGIAQAIGRDTYPANAVAAVDCVVLSWPGTIWQQTVQRYPTFATNTYAMIGSRLQDAQDRIVEMATERVEQRVASALLKLANQTGKKTAEGILIDFPISRQDISEMTGTTLHTVSRLLSAWEQQGLVKSGRQKITVTEGDRLLMLASGPNRE
ncbi:MAG: Crp/Fnr family transcriptional regulator [Hyphomicrobiales bacterium]